MITEAKRPKYMEEDMKGVTVYDNGGKTMDRFTVCILGHVYAMSHNPKHPWGVNQYVGKEEDVEMDNAGVEREEVPEYLKVAIKERKFEITNP